MSDDIVAESGQAQKAAPPGTPDPSTKGVIFTPAGSIHAEPLQWAWRDRVPLGALTLLVGHPGQGKSTLLAELAARLSRGDLEGDLKGAPVHVAIATAEDAIAQVVVPRLHAAGANLGLVHIIEVREKDGLTRALILPVDVEGLRERVIGAAVRLVAIDPLVAHLPVRLDSYSDQHVRRALAPLAAMAEQAGAAVVAVVHLNKNDKVRDALARIGGSVGLAAAARSVLLLRPDPEDPKGAKGATKVVAHVKSNLGPTAPALKLLIEEHVIEQGGKPPIRTGRIKWCGEAADANLIAQEPDEKPSAVDEAKEWIHNHLADGPAPADDMEQARKILGIAEQTWKRAKAELGVHSHKIAAAWFWFLPPCQYCHAKQPAPLSPWSPWTPSTP
jgi:hypothetical protein